jgi:hypothetical protein
MKKTVYTLIILLSLLLSKANANPADSIPNGGFESWSIISWTETPTYWMVNNSQVLAPQIVRDSDAYSGFTALKIGYLSEYPPQAWCDFNISSHPSNVGGYVKNQLGIGDSVIFTVRIFSNQLLIDSGYLVFYGGINPNYSSFIVPVSQNSLIADSCEISILGGMTTESSIIFDDLQFDFSQGISRLLKTDFSYYPNPCRDNFFLRINRFDFQPEEIEAYNINGQKCKLEMSIDKTTSDGYLVQVNTKKLNEGVWLVLLMNDNETYSLLLQKY